MNLMLERSHVIIWSHIQCISVGKMIHEILPPPYFSSASLWRLSMLGNEPRPSFYKGRNSFWSWNSLSALPQILTASLRKVTLFLHFLYEFSVHKCSHLTSFVGFRGSSVARLEEAKIRSAYYKVIYFSLTCSEGIMLWFHNENVFHFSLAENWNLWPWNPLLVGWSSKWISRHYHLPGGYHWASVHIPFCFRLISFLPFLRDVHTVTRSSGTEQKCFIGCKRNGSSKQWITSDRCVIFPHSPSSLPTLPPSTHRPPLSSDLLQCTVPPNRQFNVACFKIPKSLAEILGCSAPKALHLAVSCFQADHCQWFGMSCDLWLTDFISWHSLYAPWWPLPFSDISVTFKCWLYFLLLLFLENLNFEPQFHTFSMNSIHSMVETVLLVC